MVCILYTRFDLGWRGWRVKSSVSAQTGEWQLLQLLLFNTGTCKSMIFSLYLGSREKPINCHWEISWFLGSRLEIFLDGVKFINKNIDGVTMGCRFSLKISMGLRWGYKISRKNIVMLMWVCSRGMSLITDWGSSPQGYSPPTHPGWRDPHSAGQRCQPSGPHSRIDFVSCSRLKTSRL